MRKSIIRSTVYKDGIMVVTERKSIITTPLRERDTLIEWVFDFVPLKILSKEDLEKQRNSAYKYIIE